MKTTAIKNYEKSLSDDNKNKDKTFIFTYMFIIFISVIAMLLFAFNTSPAIQYIGNDSGMYLIMGKAMAHGRVLYTDLFDHKGPLIFVLNMLPQLLIDGMLGVWLMELCIIIISSLILYKIADEQIHNKYSILVPCIYICITVSLFNGGNYTEEYSNFFNIIALYMFNKWLNTKNVTSCMAYIYGLCIAFVFFMRPNNIAFIASVILIIGIDMLLHERKQILRVIAFGFLGIFTITMPIIIYHSCAGTLYDMFYATILHNLIYCGTGSEIISLLPRGNSSQKLCVLTCVIINIIAVCKCYSKNNNKNANFIIVSFALTVLAISLGGRQFIYYWTLIAPVTAYSLIFVIKSEGNKKKSKKYKSFVINAFAILLMFINSFFATNIIEKKQLIDEYKSFARDMYSYIPQNEKADCFAYDMPAILMYYLDLNTPCKYFTMQSWMSKTNPDINQYCFNFVKDNKPKWLLCYDQYGDGCAELSKEVKSSYTKVFQNECGYLYKRMVD